MPYLELRPRQDPIVQHPKYHLSELVDYLTGPVIFTHHHIQRLPFSPCVIGPLIYLGLSILIQPLDLGISQGL